MPDRHGQGHHHQQSEPDSTLYNRNTNGTLALVNKAPQAFDPQGLTDKLIEQHQSYNMYDRIQRLELQNILQVGQANEAMEDTFALAQSNHAGFLLSNHPSSKGAHTTIIHDSCRNFLITVCFYMSHRTPPQSPPVCCSHLHTPDFYLGRLAHGSFYWLRSSGMPGQTCRMPLQ